MSFFNAYKKEPKYNKLTDPNTGESWEFIDESTLPQPEDQVEDKLLYYYYQIYKKSRLILQCTWNDFLDTEIDIVMCASEEADQMMEQINKAMPKSNKKDDGKPKMPIINYDHMVLLVTLSQMFGGSEKKGRR